MNKRMRELMSAIQTKTAEAKSLLSGENKDVPKATALMDEVDALQKEYDLEKRVYEADKANGIENTTAPVTPKTEKTVDVVAEFGKAVKSGFLINKGAMTEGTGANGGYTVPQDIITKIYKLKEERATLSKLIDREVVSTNSGRRTYKKRSNLTGFSKVGEGAKIGEAQAPEFAIIEYTIQKYAGYIPVTNELLADSDANVGQFIIEWLADEANATENKEIMSLIGAHDDGQNVINPELNEAGEVSTLAALDCIKKVVNVHLANYKGTVNIIMGASKFNELDTFKDADNRYFLAPDPNKHMEPRLSIGTQYVPIVVVPDNMGFTGIAVGDFKEYLKMFDRKQLTITTSDTASVTGFNAFEQDMTLFRGIMRADFVEKDTGAAYYIDC